MRWITKNWLVVNRQETVVSARTNWSISINKEYVVMFFGSSTVRFLEKLLKY